MDRRPAPPARRTSAKSVHSPSGAPVRGSSPVVALGVAAAPVPLPVACGISTFEGGDAAGGIDVVGGKGRVPACTNWTTVPGR
jgi:hypothetical protein